MSRAGCGVGSLPYACPMDHIYDLPSWFNPGMPDFREPGFLDDLRVPDARKASVGGESSSIATGHTRAGNRLGYE